MRAEGFGSRKRAKSCKPRQRVSPSRGDLQRLRSISSISWPPVSSSLVFQHQKYFCDVTQPAMAASHSNTPCTLSPTRSRATLAAVLCKVRVFEPEEERRGDRGAPLRANRSRRYLKLERYW